MKSECHLVLTQKALRDLQGILDYSIQQWGKQAAEKYFDELEQALERVKEHPGLLTRNPNFHSSLQFYRVNKHLLVCDVLATSIVVLTVLHASMDILNRLAELEPTLAAEVELLHRNFRESKRRKS